VKALMLSIDDIDDDFDKEDKMNNAEVKEMECRRRQRRLRSAMLPTSLPRLGVVVESGVHRFLLTT
jgi:hypothetical protein